MHFSLQIDLLYASTIYCIYCRKYCTMNLCTETLTLSQVAHWKINTGPWAMTRTLENRSCKWCVCVLDQYLLVMPMGSNLKQANWLSIDGTMSGLVQDQVICMLKLLGEWLSLWLISCTPQWISAFVIHANKVNCCPHGIWRPCRIPLIHSSFILHFILL
jgi:hypothetical protein